MGAVSIKGKTRKTSNKRRTKVEGKKREGRVMFDRIAVWLVPALVFFVMQTASCEKVDSFGEDGDDNLVTGDIRFSQVDSSEWLYRYQDGRNDAMPLCGKEAVQHRAMQLAKIQWMPKYYSIPSRYGSYHKNATYTGVPYSLAIKTDSHIGTQVSLYAFMTAVDNPYSVLYTEDLRKAPYNGFDCAPYYGSTCSNSIMYALGVEPPYYTYMIPSIPGMVRMKDQSPISIEPCDILLKEGHVVMVYDVDRDAVGEMTRVQIFETTSSQQKDTWIRNFTKEEFLSYWGKNSFVRYQYSKMGDVQYYPSMFVPLDGESGVPNYRPLEICITRGDRATFWKGQVVKVAVLAKGYSYIAVFRNDTLIKEIQINNSQIVDLKDLDVGLYKVRLMDKSGYYGSHFSSFEIIDASVTAQKAATTRIDFSCDGASARYLCICDGDHNPYNYYQFTDEDRNRGYFEMPAFSGLRTTHYKVYFQGAYGTVATEIKSF